MHFPTPLMNRIKTAALVALALAGPAARAAADCNAPNPDARTRVELRTSYGPLCVELWDREDETPLSVANFLGYVERGDFAETFFHRLVPGSVLQGGGFRFDADYVEVEAQPEIPNEAQFDNALGTIATAKRGPSNFDPDNDRDSPDYDPTRPDNDPNTQTTPMQRITRPQNQFYFNLRANPGFDPFETPRDPNAVERATKPDTKDGICVANPPPEDPNEPVDPNAPIDMDCSDRFCPDPKNPDDVDCHPDEADTGYTVFGKVVGEDLDLLAKLGASHSEYGPWLIEHELAAVFGELPVTNPVKRPRKGFGCVRVLPDPVSGVGPLFETSCRGDPAAFNASIELTRESLAPLVPPLLLQLHEAVRDPAPTCPSAPVACTEARKASLTVSEKSARGAKLSASLSGFAAATERSDFGDPLGGADEYAACIYDDADVLVAALDLLPGGALCGGKNEPCWKESGSSGLAYKDKNGIGDGVRKLVAKGGAAGKGKLTLEARHDQNRAGTDLPTGIPAALAGATHATLQVHTGPDACYSAVLDAVKTATSTAWKAKAD